MLIEISSVRLDGKLRQFATRSRRVDDLARRAAHRGSQRLSQHSARLSARQCQEAMDYAAQFKALQPLEPQQQEQLVGILNRGVAASEFLVSQETEHLDETDKLKTGCGFLDSALLVFPQMLTAHAPYCGLWRLAHVSLAVQAPAEAYLQRESLMARASSTPDETAPHLALLRFLARELRGIRQQVGIGRRFAPGLVR